MGHNDVTTEQIQTTHDHGLEASSTRAAVLGGVSRQGLPLFKRFGVSKEWRAKDGAVG